MGGFDDPLVMNVNRDFSVEEFLPKPKPNRVSKYVEREVIELDMDFSIENAAGK